MAFRSVTALPLTRRELEVADLVRDGLTNKEIAARLFLSERTVEGHVAQICNKLGLHSRLQVATWVLEQEARAEPSMSAVQPVAMPKPKRLPSAPPRPQVLVAGGLILAIAVAGVVVGLRNAIPQRMPFSPPISTVLDGLNLPAGVVADSDRGVIYVADTGNNRIRMLWSDGTRDAFDGTAFGLALNHPTGLAVDRRGRLYVADTGNNRVVVYDRYYLAVVAGSGEAGFSGDEGQAATAQLNQPQAIAVDASGNVFVADTGNNRIREIDGATGLIHTVAGGGDTDPFTADYLGLYPLTIRLHQPAGVAVTGAGDLLIADTAGHAVVEIPHTAQGSFGPIRRVTTDARDPQGLALRHDGAVVFADSGSNRIRQMAAGQLSTLAGAGSLGFSGDGAVATQAALAYPAAVSIDSGGNLYIADTGNGRLRFVGQRQSSLLNAVTSNARPSFPSGSFMAQLQRRGRMVAIVRSWQPFFAYRDRRSGRLEGFDVDMIRAVARAIFGRDDASVLTLISPPPGNARFVDLRSGQGDIADATLVNDSNLALVDLADPYLRTVDLLVTRTASAIQSFADLSGKRLCVVNAGTIGPQLIAEAKEAQPGLAGLIDGDRGFCLDALHTARVDAIYGHSPDTVAIAAADPTLAFTTALLTPRNWAWAVAKGHPEFVQFLNRLVAQMQKDGTWAREAKLWLNGYDDTFNVQLK